MRIGLLTTSFPRHERDVAGIFVLGFARALVAAGHRVDVLAPEPKEPGLRPDWPGVQVHAVPYLRPRALQRTFYGAGVPDNLARDPLAWLGLAPFTAALTAAARSCTGSWDAVFSHWALPCALAAGWAVGRHIPHVAVLHSADVHLLGRLPVRRQLAGRIAASARALWFVNDEQRCSFRRLLPAGHSDPRSLVCPMGVELPASAASDRSATRRRYDLSRFSVLSLGRLVPIKGLDVLIRACAGSNVTLVIAGDGPERARLVRLADAVHADVRFVGGVFGAEKTELLRAVDAFALPSRRMADGRSEGLPTALLEALAHELPVIASRSAGIEPLLDSAPFAQCQVAAHDAMAWRAALTSLRTLCPIALSEHGRWGRAAIAPYVWPNVAARALSLLDNPATDPNSMC